MSTFPKPWLPFAALAVAGVLAGAWIARTTLTPAAVPAPALKSGTWLPEPREIHAPAFVDSRGEAFTAAGFAGHASLLFLGFTHCPDVCPTTLALLARVRRATQAAVTVYLVSVDPERDTPEVLQRYLASFDPEFIGLAAAPLDMKAFARTLGAAVAKVDLPGGNYAMDHSATLYLLDDGGRLRAVFTPPLDTKTLAADLDAAVAASRG
jgi:protein SCO1/2